MNPAALGILITVIFVGALLAGSFIYWTLASRREARAQSMARRRGTLHDAEAARDLFQSKARIPW